MTDVSDDIKDVAIEWLRISPQKMIIATLCGILIYFGWYVRDEVKFFVHAAVMNYARNYENDFDVPTSIPARTIEKINTSLKKDMSTRPLIGAITLYEFVPKGSDILYQGRIAVTSVSTTGKDLLERYNAKWIPMNVNRFLIEKILRGETYTRPAKIDGDISENLSPDTTNYYLVKQDGYEMNICIPVIGNLGQVRGYISFLLLSKPNTSDEFQKIKEDLGTIAIEISQFF